MNSDDFDPRIDINTDLMGYWLGRAGLLGMGAEAKASSQNLGFEAEKAIDGDPDTMWHSQYEQGTAAHPHDLDITLPVKRALRTVKILPRQDGNPNGLIRQYEVYVSAEPDTWGEPIAAGAFEENDTLKIVELKPPVHGRFIRVRALSGFDGKPFAAIADLSID
jgi:hypothetical protein